MKRLILELCLKPFYDLSPDGVKTTLREILRRWQILIRQVKEISILSFGWLRMRLAELGYSLQVWLARKCRGNLRTTTRKLTFRLYYAWTEQAVSLETSSRRMT